jgi:hypothetical protein
MILLYSRVEGASADALLLVHPLRLLDQGSFLAFARFLGRVLSEMPSHRCSVTCGSSCALSELARPGNAPAVDRIGR